MTNSQMITYSKLQKESQHKVFKVLINKEIKTYSNSAKRLISYIIKKDDFENSFNLLIRDREHNMQLFILICNLIPEEFL